MVDELSFQNINKRPKVVEQLWVCFFPNLAEQIQTILIYLSKKTNHHEK